MRPTRTLPAIAVVFATCTLVGCTESPQSVAPLQTAEQSDHAVVQPFAPQKLTEEQAVTKVSDTYIALSNAIYVDQDVDRARSLAAPKFKPAVEIMSTGLSEVEMSFSGTMRVTNVELLAFRETDGATHVEVALCEDMSDMSVIIEGKMVGSAPPGYEGRPLKVTGLYEHGEMLIEAALPHAEHSCS